MVSFFTTTLAALCLALTTPAASTDNKVEARRPDHWGSIAWGNSSHGACGYTNIDSDLVTAVSPSLYEREHPCGRNMVVTYGEREIVVKVVDKCAGCAENDLVLSPAAFQALAGDLSIGRITATWDFEDMI